jgi:hypothetical protein
MAHLLGASDFCFLEMSFDTLATAVSVPCAGVSFGFFFSE